METIKVILAVNSQQVKDELIALLAESGYDGFEETESGLIAYIGIAEFNKDELATILLNRIISYQTETIEPQNWNALWESNFEPVIIPDFCTIQADFHKIAVTTPYQILITPKMSFGTGHHATTQLMMNQMKEINFEGKTVLDFGTGTGVLAILSEMLGAKSVLAIDNDEWSVINATENIFANKCNNIVVSNNTISTIPLVEYDIILANINRHILLENIEYIYKQLKKGGKVLISGILKGDEEFLTFAAKNCNLEFCSMEEQSGWIVLVYKK